MNTFQLIRYNKIHHEPLYLLNKEEQDDKLIFSLSGSTANIYKITLYQNSRKLFCNCPDAKSWARKHNCLCKHICFILFKVFKYCIDKDTTLLFNTLTLSLDEFNLIKDKYQELSLNLDNEYINQDYLDKFTKLSNNNIPNDVLFSVDKIIDTKEDDCPICYDLLKNVNNCVQCPICQNIFHNKCMDKWTSSGNNTCPYCRSGIWKKFNKNTSDYDNLLE